MTEAAEVKDHSSAGMYFFWDVIMQLHIIKKECCMACLACCLQPDRDALRFLNSPSLLLQEKPKQRRKTNTKEIHIMATDAFADLVKSGGSSKNEQWQKSKVETSS